MQLQSMRNEGLEIGGIGGGEFCGLCFKREDAAGEKTLHGMAQQRGGRGSGMKFHPNHCGTAEEIATGQNQTGCLMMGVGRVLRSNQ